MSVSSTPPRSPSSPDWGRLFFWAVFVITVSGWGSIYLIDHLIPFADPPQEAAHERAARLAPVGRVQLAPPAAAQPAAAPAPAGDVTPELTAAPGEREATAQDEAAPEHTSEASGPLAPDAPAAPESPHEPERSEPAPAQPELRAEPARPAWQPPPLPSSGAWYGGAYPPRYPSYQAPHQQVPIHQQPGAVYPYRYDPRPPAGYAQPHWQGER